MGDGLKMVAGNKLEAFLYRMTNTPLKGVALGTGVTLSLIHIFLKQNQNAPVPVEKQVAILYAVTKGVLESVKVEDVNVYAVSYTHLDVYKRQSSESSQITVSFSK